MTTLGNWSTEKSDQSRWMAAFVGPRHTKGDPERSPLDYSRVAFSFSDVGATTIPYGFPPYKSMTKMQSASEKGAATKPESLT